MAGDFTAIRKRLEAEKERLTVEMEQSKLNVSTSDERREGSPFGKREEEANEASELEKRLALESRIRRELAQIELALEKIAKGTYGVCSNCGKVIEQARLDALPAASLCLTCKAQQGKDARVKPFVG